MTAAVRRICLITPGHVASTPRLVKNADALAAAGYEVHVVAGRHFPPADALDATLLAGAAWPCTRVDLGRSGPGLFRKLLRELSRRRILRSDTVSAAAAARALHADALHLGRIAAGVGADFYFGHCLAGLPAAAAAAAARGVRYGFDAEDFHDLEGEFPPAERRARRLVQTHGLPGCALFTTAAPLMAERYAADYGRRPMVLLNTFPLAESPAAPVPAARRGTGQPARLYWFSQTIGPGRGLEVMVAVLGRMRTPAELHLRGFVSDAYRHDLQTRARAAGCPGRLVFLPPGPPREMVRLAAGMDLGLALEQSTPPNRDLCLTNKVFAYLLAGVPQLLSPTAAQAALAPALDRAALLARPESTAETAALLDRWFGDAAGMAAARETAWDLGRRRYCWDLEQKALLAAVAEIGPGPAARA